MARAGWFDSTGLPLGWFDETGQAAGWFDVTNLDPAGGAGPVNYVLTCAVGTYTYTGNTTSLKVAHSLICAPGSYSYTGQIASLKVVHSLVCSTGAYSYTGVDSSLKRASSLLCSTGQYLLVGNDVTLTYSAGTPSTLLLVNLSSDQSRVLQVVDIFNITGIHYISLDTGKLHRKIGTTNFMIDSN